MPCPAASIRYSPELAGLICGRVAAGETLAEICRGPDMPAKETAHRWIRRWPEFEAAYRRARETANAAAIARDRAAAKARRERMAVCARGQVSTYSRQAAEAVCARIAAGETPQAIGEDPDMPSRTSIYKWLREEPEFVALYREARIQQAEAKFDMAWEIAERATPATVSVARLQCDVLRWQVGLLAPRKYARADGQDGGPDGGEAPEPITVTIRRFEVIDGEVVEI